MNGGIMKGLLLLFGLGFMLCFGVILAGGGKDGTETGTGTGEQVHAPASVSGAKARSVSGRAARVSAVSEAQTDSDGNTVLKGTITAANARTIQAAAAHAEAGSAGSNHAGAVKDSEAAADPGMVMKPSFVNHASNRMGDALRRGARALIGGVVSVFDAVTGS